jgi:starvation-inducible outer membrane lipoprotein
MGENMRIKPLILIILMIAVIITSCSSLNKNIKNENQIIDRQTSVSSNIEEIDHNSTQKLNTKIKDLDSKIGNYHVGLLMIRHIVYTTCTRLLSSIT